jgi:hypothetical protein
MSAARRNPKRTRKRKIWTRRTKKALDCVEFEASINWFHSATAATNVA